MLELNQEEIALTSGIGKCFCKCKYALYQVPQKKYGEYSIDFYNHELCFTYSIFEVECHRKCCIEYNMLGYKSYEDIELESIFDLGLSDFYFYQSC